MEIMAILISSDGTWIFAFKFAFPEQQRDYVWKWLAG